jgi:aspartyl aminopeptidase
MSNPALKRLCDFLDASPTAFHAVDSMAAALLSQGAIRLDERSAWRLEPGAMYFVERGLSSLVAFRPGFRSPAETGFAIAGAHTDSPALKARIEKRLSSKGAERVAVEVYGVPILSTWLDRPLSLAGRLTVRVGSGQESRVESRLVNLARPLGVVPNLAIHLNREVNKGFEYNAQGHLPVLVSAIGMEGDSAAAAEGQESTGPSWALRLAAGEIGVEPSEILGADLFFVDAQKACLMGEREELVNGHRLDDLSGCHAILEAFLDSAPAAHGQVACFVDNEEIGSKTRQGADSSLLRDLLGRICSLSVSGPQDFYRALASSFLVSVDVAQAWHPSYAEKYDEHYSPLLNGGPAVKSSANYKYATDAATEARFRLLCEGAGVSCQKYMTRADMVPGTTIGTMSSALTGVSTVDVGAPLLSMHSIRETMGARDHESMIAVLGRHFAEGPWARF